MEHIEYEERVLISQVDYERIVADFKDTKNTKRYIHIENIYLDTDDMFITNRKMMLRIRNINNKEQELTLKFRNKDNSTVEINETQTCHPLIDENLPISFDKCHPIVNLITERIEIEFDNYLLVIDKNEYCGKIDYNIEIESSSQALSKKIILEYCKKYHLTYDPHYITKNYRVFNELKRSH